MRKIILFILMSSIFLCGCSGAVEKESDNTEETMKSLLGKHIEEIREDNIYDKKSICWDGEELTTISDKMDSEQAIDGRFGPFYNHKVDTKIGVSISIPETSAVKQLLKEEMIFEIDVFTLKNEERFLRVKHLKGEAVQEILSTLEQDEKLIKCDGKEEKLEEKGQLFEGFLEVEDEKWLIGRVFVCINEDNSDACIIEYGGIGNFSDIKVEANMIMKSLKWISTVE